MLLLAAGAAAQPSSLTGNWQGTIQTGAARQRLGLHISETQAGTYTSILDSIDQGAMGLPVDVTTLRGNAVHLELSNLHAAYDGVLNSDGSEIRGTFTQGLALPLNFRRVEQIEQVRRPQLPTPPFPYRSEELTYRNEPAGIRLGATLTIPSGDGPFPAALLITGSGPQDRDETIAGHKPFLVIADYLTRRGVAVLRVDDRGVGASQGSSTAATLDDMASDVLAGVAFLKSRKEVDPKRVGLIGHSEGGIVAPLAASKSPDVAFVVMLAGTGVSGDKVLYLQNELVLRSVGAQPEVVMWQVNLLRQMVNIARDEIDPKAASEKMHEVWQKSKGVIPEAIRDRTATGNAEAQIAMLNGPELRSFLFHDPAAILAKLKIPVLALAGSRDLQVPPEQNLPAISAALRSADNKDFEVKELSGLNHLFQKCDTCTVAEYASLDETFSPVALQAMGDWIVAHTAKQP